MVEPTVHLKGPGGSTRGTSGARPRPRPVDAALREQPCPGARRPRDRAHGARAPARAGPASPRERAGSCRASRPRVFPVTATKTLKRDPRGGQWRHFPESPPALPRAGEARSPPPRAPSPDLPVRSGLPGCCVAIATPVRRRGLCARSARLRSRRPETRAPALGSGSCRPPGPARGSLGADGVGVPPTRGSPPTRPQAGVSLVRKKDPGPCGVAGRRPRLP